MKRKKLLIFIILFSLSLHAGALFYLNRLHLSCGMVDFSKLPFFQQSDELPQEWEVSQIQQQEVSLDPSMDLTASKEKVTPLPTPSKESIAIEERSSPFSFDFTFGLFNNEDEGEIAIEAPPISSDEVCQEGPSLPLIDLTLAGKEGGVKESELFNVDVEYVQRRMHPGYVFRVTLTPKQDVAFKRIRQNFYFLVDRSHSVPRNRYFYNKQAIKEGLALLSKEDAFNILLFDDKVIRFAEKPLIATEENIIRAKAFIDAHGHGGAFTATDLATSLGKIIPQDVLDTEVNTAILLSDGDTYLPLEKQRQLIRSWSEKNKGKVTLYCVASGSGNNLDLLDMMSSFNKGGLYYASKDNQVKERLHALLYAISQPIGKEIVATGISSDPSNHIYLLPKQARLSDLYKNRPFVIYGSTSRLTEFTLFLQGKYYDRHFDIKKKIDFARARPGTITLEQLWARTLVQEHYEKFFKDGKLSHLEAAKEILVPLNVAVPFLQK